MLPPENVTPVDRVTRLKNDARPTIAVDFPRKPPAGAEPYPQIHIRVLRQAEIMTCMASAEAYALEMLKSVKGATGANGSHGYHDIYTDAKVCELLWHACRSEHKDERGHSVHAPTFVSSKDVRQMLTSDETAALFSAYSRWQAESGPLVGTMDREELDAWLDRLKDGLAQLPLHLLSSDRLNDLLMRSVARLRTSETVNISSGSPPNSISESPLPSDVDADESPVPVDTENP